MVLQVASQLLTTKRYRLHVVFLKLPDVARLAVNLKTGDSLVVSSDDLRIAWQKRVKKTVKNIESMISLEEQAVYLMIIESAPDVIVENSTDLISLLKSANQCQSSMSTEVV